MGLINPSHLTPVAKCANEHSSQLKSPIKKCVISFSKYFTSASKSLHES